MPSRFCTLCEIASNVVAQQFFEFLLVNDVNAKHMLHDYLATSSERCSVCLVTPILAKKGVWKINEEKIVPHKNAMHIYA